MKNIIDILQILISVHWMVAFIIIFLLVILFINILKFAQFSALSATAFLRNAFYIPKKTREYVLLSIYSIILVLFRTGIIDMMQRFEGYFAPLSICTKNETEVLSVYLSKARTHLNQDEFDFFVKRVYEISDKIGCDPAEFLEVCYSESSCNPFSVRSDNGAAGLIQFTPTGLVGLNKSLSDIFAICRSRDIIAMLNLTEQYMILAANGRKLYNSTEVYMAIFSPEFIGMPESSIIYQGENNPKYYKNKIFDGYALSNGKIYRSSKNFDNKITKGEVSLHLSAIRANLFG